MNHRNLEDPKCFQNVFAAIFAMEIAEIPSFHATSTKRCDQVTPLLFQSVHQSFHHHLRQNPEQGQRAPEPCHTELQHKHMRNSSIPVCFHTLRIIIIENETNKTQQNIPYQSKQSNCSALHEMTLHDASCAVPVYLPTTTCS